MHEADYIKDYKRENRILILFCNFKAKDFSDLKQKNPNHKEKKNKCYKLIDDVQEDLNKSLLNDTEFIAVHISGITLNAKLKYIVKVNKDQFRIPDVQ